MVNALGHRRTVFGLLRLQLVHYRTMLLSLLVYGIALPLGLCWWAVANTHGDPGTRLKPLIGASLVSSALILLRLTGQVPVVERVSGACRLLGTTNVTPGAYLAAHGFSAMTLGVVPLFALWVGVMFLPELAPASLVWLLPFGLLATGLSASGFLIAHLSRSVPAAALATNLLAVLLVAVCPLLYPADRVPSSIEPVVTWLPPTLAADLIESGWLAKPLDSGDLAVLFVWAVALATASIRWPPPLEGA